MLQTLERRRKYTGTILSDEHTLKSKILTLISDVKFVSVKTILKSAMLTSATLDNSY